MSKIDGRPTQYGITLKNLRELMEHRGHEGILRIQEYGGIQGICEKLYTSPNEGIFYMNAAIVEYLSNKLNQRFKWIHN